jgi:hypothetical protein
MKEISLTQSRKDAKIGRESFLSAFAALREAFCAVPDRVVSFVILLHLGITIPLAYRLSIWVDEAFTLSTTGQSIAYAFYQAMRFELQPPLYYVVLNLWRGLNGSIFFARLFSILCIALAIKVSASLAQRLWKDVHPGWVALVLAAHPLMVGAAIEIRVYALVILLTSLLLLLFFDGYLAETFSPRARWLYLLVSILSLYTYYYLGLILVANACALLVLRRWRPLLDYLARMVAVALCFAPMIWIVLGQVSTHTSSLSATSPWWGGVKFISWRIKNYILPVDEFSLIGLRRWTLRLVYVVTILAVARQGKRIFSSANLFIWTIVTALSLLYLAALRATAEDMLLPRHTSVLLLPSILLAFSVIYFIPGRKRFLIGVLIISVFNVVSLASICRSLNIERVWGPVAAYVREHEKPGQPILVFHAAAALPLAHYYTGTNTLVPLPRDHSFETFDIRDYVLRDEQEVFNALEERAPGEHDALWLVTDGVCDYLGVDYNCPALEEFVNKYYVVEQSRVFSTTQARLLRRKPRS